MSTSEVYVMVEYISHDINARNFQTHSIIANNNAVV